MTAFRLSQQHTLWLLALAVIAAAAFVLFGFIGFRAIIAVVALFIIPPLLLLQNTTLDAEEKIFFSLFIGLGLFPLLVFSVNQLLPSFRVSAIAAFILLAAAGFLWPRISQRVQKKS